MSSKSDLLGTIAVHADSLRLASVLRVLSRNGDLLEGLRSSAGEEFMRNPAASRSLQILGDQVLCIHTADQIYRTIIRSAVSEGFELARAYCRETGQVPQLKKQLWFHVIRMIRNALNHNFKFEFRPEDKAMLPLTWGAVSIDESMNGQALSLQMFSVDSALEWLGVLEEFVENELL